MSAKMTKEEISEVTSRLPGTCSVMARSIVKVYFASPNPKGQSGAHVADGVSTNDLSKDSWKESSVIGAVQFVIDRIARTYYFMVFDLEVGALCRTF